MGIFSKKEIIAGSYECRQTSEDLCEVKINVPIDFEKLTKTTALLFKKLKVNSGLAQMLSEDKEIPDKAFTVLQHATRDIMHSVIVDNQRSGMNLGSYWIKNAKLIPVMELNEKKLFLEVTYEARII